MQYYKVPNCTMKCRIYPNQAAQKCIDRIIHGVQVAYNIATYDMYTTYRNTKEITAEDGNVYHFVDYKTLTKKENLDWLREQHPDIRVVPGGALSGRGGAFISDHQRAMSHRAIEYTRKDGKVIRKHDKKARTGKGGALRPYSLEKAQISYYSKRFPRRSYTYQTSLKSNIAFSENENVFYVLLVNVTDPTTGKKIPIKVRGWDKRLRFAASQEEFDLNTAMDFRGYVQNLEAKKAHTITILKDAAGMYWLTIKLADAYIPMAEAPAGVEVGVYSNTNTTATLSNGTVYDNQHFKEIAQEHIGGLSAKLSRKQGWANEKFRALCHADPQIGLSKSYLETQRKHAALEQRIARKRKLHNHIVSSDVVKNAFSISIEDRDLSAEMERATDTYERADVATGQLLDMIQYKSSWYGRVVNKTTEDPELRCSNCGHVFPKVPGSASGYFTCTECSSVIKAELNAAKNILYYSQHPAQADCRDSHS